MRPVWQKMLGTMARFVLLAGCGGCMLAHSTRAPVQAEAEFRGRVTRDVSARYLVYTPMGYTKDRREKWPLLLFLHGAGERGDSLKRILVNGPPKLVQTDAHFPFVVVSPQARADSIWSNLALDALIDDVVRRYAIDPDRIYLTGLSMGGYGVWQMAMEFPRRFAAIVPVSAGGVPSGACALKHMSIWAFHGAKDDIVPLDRAQQIIDRIRTCPGKTGDVRLTVYPEATHDAWTRAYSESGMFMWLLEQRRKPAGP